MKNKFKKIIYLNYIHNMTVISKLDEETKFQNYYLEKSISRFRVSILFSAFFYLFFYCLDTIIIPDIKNISLLVRILVSLYSLFLYFISHKSLFKALSQLLTYSISFFAGLGIVAMMALSKDDYSYTYCTGLILVVQYCTLVFQVKFKTSILIGSSIFMMYGLVSIFKEYPTEIFIGNNIFLLASILFCILSSYQNERIDRQIYNSKIYKEQIKEKKEVLKNVYGLIHSGPLQTLSSLIRELKSYGNPDHHQLDILINLNQEIRDIYQKITKELVEESNIIYLRNSTKIDIELSLDELLYEVFYITIDQDMPNFKQIKVKIVDFDCSLAQASIPRDMKKDLCLFLEEAIINVGKHAKNSTKIDVKGTVNNKEIILRVVDNGLSMLPSENVNGLGTQLIEEIAKKWSGKFSLSPIESIGTSCELKIYLEK